MHFQTPLILGLGAFGFPIIHHLASKHPEIQFYGYEKDDAARISLQTTRKHPFFYSERELPLNVTVVDTPEEILASCDVLILAIPNQFIASSIAALASSFGPQIRILNLSKGINNQTLETVSESIANITGGDIPYAVLSGGMIAAELMEGKTLGADIASVDHDFTYGLKELFESENLHIAVHDDPKTVELFGALKNVFALYIGYLEGRGYEFSSIGYHFCELYKDMQILIEALGGHTPLAFEHYALGGDIIATCFGKSRNRYLGNLVGSGKNISDALEILKSEKKHSEGYETLKGIDIFLTKHPELEMTELKKVRDIFLNIDIS